jgi:membrane-associated phospholipid phosphatase
VSWNRRVRRDRTLDDPPESGGMEAAAAEAVSLPYAALAANGEEYRATDRLIFAALVFGALLTLVFSAKVEGWESLMLKYAGSIAVLFGLRWLRKVILPATLGFAIRLTGILLIYAFLNNAAAPLQLIIHHQWLDSSVLSMEHAIFGVQPTLWLERIVSRPLTEWMFFAYIFYIPMHPAMFGIVHARHGARASEEFFFTLGISNFMCNTGFILFPVAGPFFHLAKQYTVPLQGYWFGALGEFLRVHLQFIGGTIPSPHCASATVMWLMAYRYWRPGFWILSPVVFSLYVSTFYLRYHYVTDMVVGIAVGLVAVWAAPKLMKIVSAFSLRP